MRKHPLAKCEECVFQHAPFVPTQNPHPRAKLAVIGEAPGSYEAGRGIPFTGPSGKLLDQVLSHHGYERSEVMVTNICLCRPANNDDPPKSAIAACKPRLDAEIASSGVDRILAVGGTAASNLIDPRKKISALRVGPPKPYIEDQEVQVVASWHPAYCLRAPDTFPSFVSDTGKLRGKTQYNKPWVPAEYKVFDTSSATLQVIERLWQVPGPLVIDIETGFEKDDDFEHADQFDMICIGISYATGKVAVIANVPLRNPQVQEKLGDLLRAKKVVGHNIKSDLAGMRPYFGIIEAAGDTMLQSYCQDERPGLHALEKLGVEILGTPPWKTNFKRYLPKDKNYAKAARWRLHEYNAEDVHVTRTLWDLNNANMNEREIREHEFLIQAANAIVNLEMAGITFDLRYSLDLKNELEAEIEKFEEVINETAGITINPRSPQQITRWFASKGMQIPNTQKDFLEAVLAKTHDEQIRQFITQLLLHRRRTKLNGTYVKGFHKRIHDDKIYTTYTLHGTTSGRLASKNPNMQNIVRDKRIKHQFTVESDDNVLIQVDYKQAEGRVITTLAQDEYLADLFRDPTKDIFNDMCDQIYGSGNYGKEERVKIKSVFYGLAYGREAASIGVELGISYEEAKELLENFKALIPATVSWQASIRHKVLSGEDLVTPFGRKRSFWLITESNKKDVINEALSFMPQSIASDICLTSLINLQPMLRGLATTRLTIHDAMIFEAHKDDADEVVKIVRDEMVAAGRAFTNYVPFEVDVSIGKRWSEL